MEESEMSDAASLKEEDLATHGEQEAEEEEYIGVDPQETRNSYEHESNFAGFEDLLCTQIEIKEEEIDIKEEEIELEPGLLPEGEEGDDPIGGVEAAEDTSTDSAEEVVREPAPKQRKVTGNVLLKVQKTLKPMPEYQALAPAQKMLRPILPKPTNVPQFVPGLMKNVERSSDVQCLECGLCFKSPVSFASHRKQLHVPLVDFAHPCAYCKRRFNTRVNLQRHLLHHTRLETFRCSVCHLSMNGAKTLAQHLADHRKPNAFHKCNLCALHFDSAEQLETHNIDLHTKLPKVSKVVLPTDLICFACGKTKQTAAELRNHMRTHKGAVECKFCSSSQNNIDKLAIHVAKFHKDHRTVTYDYCPNCNKIFLSQQQMTSHKSRCALPRSLNGRFRLECHICNMSYFDEEHYETHMRLHATLGQEEHRRACRLCSFYSKSASDYATHMCTVHGFRDTVESLENGFDKMGGLQCVMPKCKRTPRLPGQPFHHLPDVRAQPERWNHLVRTFGLPWNFEPRPTHRICSMHAVVFNAGA